MKWNRALVLTVLCVSLLCFSVKLAYAEDPDIDLTDLPNALGDQLGISSFSAGIILTALLLFPFNMVLLLWSKGGTIAIIVNFVFLGFFTSIGWIPNWTVLLVGLIIAGLYATKIKEMI